MRWVILIVAICGVEFSQAKLMDELRLADEAADAVVNSIQTSDELRAKQSLWRQCWIKAIGGLPERTPLNVKLGPVFQGDGFSLQNVLFESQPGVYVVGHLLLPSGHAFKPPYPCVMMPLGHSDEGILAKRYAAHLVAEARAGHAAFAWDPIGQGERRQKWSTMRDFSECSVEHTCIGSRAWLTGWNFARFRIWDAIRAVDYVCTRPEIDKSRIGVAGTSGGGTMSTFMQALDERITVAFPNCYVSSLRAVFTERGCHDAEQFFWNMLPNGINHAAMLAMGQPRVALATGSRWKDYFPHHGAVQTYAVFTNMMVRLGYTKPTWHFHCDGPHGLPAPTRAAQIDWMNYCLAGGEPPQSVSQYWALSTGDHSGANDPCMRLPLPFPASASFFCPTHNVSDLPGFRSVFTLLVERADALSAARKARAAADCAAGRDLVALNRERACRRAVIRPLKELLRLGITEADLEPYQHHFGWWYLKGPYGVRRENEAALMATLGRSAVGRDAERLILHAFAEKQTTGKLSPLRAKGADCIAAAHAYAAEPQLFSELILEDLPSSWTEAIKSSDTSRDSYATAVWGALEEYDWVDLLPQKKNNL